MSAVLSTVTQFFPKHKQRLLLVLLLIVAAGLKLIRLGIPADFYFDEIYHVPAAKLMADNDPRAYDSGPGTVEITGQLYHYDWLHPPLVKLMQAGSIKLLGFYSWGWRLPSIAGSVVLTIAVYGLAKTIWLGSAQADNASSHRDRDQARWFGLLAALLVNLSGLALVQSRIAMNDIWLAAFVTLAVWFYFKFLFSQHSRSGQLALFAAEEKDALSSEETVSRRRTTGRRRLLLLSGVFFGLAIAAKWTGVWPLLLLLLVQLMIVIVKRQYKLMPLSVFCLLLVPAAIYVFSYSQMFLQGQGWKQFVELQRQVFWYQTHRTAGHAYASGPAVWLFNLRPVWYWRGDPQLPELTANIYALGNFSMQWLALPSLVFVAGLVIVNRLSLRKPAQDSALVRSASLAWGLLLLVYLSVWLPWLLIGRVSFYYHYLPAVPFLVIFVSLFLWWLRSLSRWSFRLLLIIMTANFVVFYPHWTGIPVSKLWAEAIYFSVSSWR